MMKTKQSYQDRLGTAKTHMGKREGG
eukprot:COSAG06_NODE_51323_length_313_cov_0.626168_1_plen_25_part_10